MSNHFAKNLRTLRDRKGYSRARLAMNFKGIDKKNIQTWENGHQPPFNRLIELADYFKVSTDTILREEL